MQARAIHKHARMSPRKIRPLAAALRGLPVGAAARQLAFTPGKASQIVRQVLASAVANAVANDGIAADTLKIASVTVNEGLKMHRFQPASRGMAHPIIKRTSHITVVVESEAVANKKDTKNNMETITADVYTAQGGKDEEVVEQEVPTLAEAAEGEPRAVETQQDKQMGEAFQKTKMMQQGGNRKKSHRRKSA